MLKRTLVIMLALLIGAGCQSADNPLSPDDATGDIIPEITHVSGSVDGNRVLWGLFEWVIDLEAETFEAIPLRSAEMHINASKFIDMPPSKFTFSNFDVDKIQSTIGLDVGITHPFPTKPNLAGIGVRQVVLDSDIKEFQCRHRFWRFKGHIAGILAGHNGRGQCHRIEDVSIR